MFYIKANGMKTSIGSDNVFTYCPASAPHAGKSTMSTSPTFWPVVAICTAPPFTALLAPKRRLQEKAAK